MEQPADHSLVMPFLTVASKGGPHEDNSYVAGYEMGSLSGLLEFSQPVLHGQYIHAENVAQADLIAMRYGYSIECQESDIDSWIYLLLTKADVDRKGSDDDRPAA